MVTLLPIADLQGPPGPAGPQGPPGPAGAEGTIKLFSPMMPEFGAVGDGVTDDQTALEACWLAAGDENGMVVIDRPYGFSGKIKHYGGMSVMQTAMPKVKVTPTGPEPGLIALTADAWYQYGDGGDGSGSANDNPGPIRGLYIDGAGIAGGGDGLFVMDANESSIYDLWVANSIGVGVNVGRSQNNNFYNLNVGACDGTAVLLKPLVAGQQGPGHNVFFGGHIHDCYLPVLVTSHSASDFFFPHDNSFVNTIIETGRVVDQPIRAAVVLESGQTKFTDVIFTFGAQVGSTNPVEEDCSILVDNPFYVAYSTVLDVDGGSIGGGANGVTDAIRIKQSGAANMVRLGDNVAFANVDNKICNDGIVLGGCDPLLSIGVNDRESTGGIANIRLINGATSLNAYRRSWFGNIFEKPAGIANGTYQNPITIKYEDETYSRYTVDWNGLQRYLDPDTGATIGGTLRSGAVWGVTGRWGIANGMYRAPVLQTLAADGAIAINWENTSYQVVAFGATGVDATSVSFTSTTPGATPTDGQEVRFGFSGSGVNTINWTGSGITFDGTPPQPIDGLFQFVTLIYRTGLGWFELSRSHHA